MFRKGSLPEKTWHVIICEDEIRRHTRRKKKKKRETRLLTKRQRDDGPPQLRWSVGPLPVVMLRLRDTRGWRSPFERCGLHCPVPGHGHDSVFERDPFGRRRAVSRHRHGRPGARSRLVVCRSWQFN